MQFKETKVNFNLVCSKQCRMYLRKLIAAIRHPTSDIWDSTSDIRHPTSDIRHPTSEIRHPTSDIWHLTSNIRDSTSDIWKDGRDVYCLGSRDLRSEVWKETMRTILVLFNIFIILHCCECVLPRYAPSLGNVQRSRILFRSVRWI